MDFTVVLIGVFAVFIPALILPGPDFVAVVRSSISHGTRAGLLTTLGVSCGLCLYATLSLLGLSAILVEYQWLTWTIRILGGTYLFYLGIKLIRATPQTIEILDETPSERHNAITFGFLVTLTNPKAIVLFASVFATAVTPTTTMPQMVLMIGMVTIASLMWYSLVSVFMSSEPVINRFQNAKHWIERAAGVCFIAIGCKILADARSPISP
jgi:threonine efflux protein